MWHAAMYHVSPGHPCLVYTQTPGARNTVIISRNTISSRSQILGPLPQASSSDVMKCAYVRIFMYYLLDILAILPDVVR
jgi:hypothetical protein